jgi:hypothetical protein
MLTIILVIAPESRDTARLACLCHGTWFMRTLTKTKKEGHVKRVLEMELP